MKYEMEYEREEGEIEDTDDDEEDDAFNKNQNHTLTQSLSHSFKRTSDTSESAEEQDEVRPLHPRVSCVVWKGTIVFGNLIKLETSACALTPCCQDIMSYLPNKIYVSGRMDLSDFRNYLNYLKRTNNSKVFDVVRFVSSSIKEHTRFYRYFHHRKKIGVIQDCPTPIRRVYILPLPSKNRVPSRLGNLRGIPEPRSNLLLGVIMKEIGGQKTGESQNISDEDYRVSNTKAIRNPLPFLDEIVDYSFPLAKSILPENEAENCDSVTPTLLSVKEEDALVRDLEYLPSHVTDDSSHHLAAGTRSFSTDHITPSPTTSESWSSEDSIREANVTAAEQSKSPSLGSIVFLRYMNERLKNPLSDDEKDQLSYLWTNRENFVNMVNDTASSSIFKSQKDQIEMIRRTIAQKPSLDIPLSPLSDDVFEDEENEVTCPNEHVIENDDVKGVGRRSESENDDVVYGEVTSNAADEFPGKSDKCDSIDKVEHDLLRCTPVIGGDLSDEDIDRRNEDADSCNAHDSYTEKKDKKKSVGEAVGKCDVDTHAKRINDGVSEEPEYDNFAYDLLEDIIFPKKGETDILVMNSHEKTH